MNEWASLFVHLISSPLLRNTFLIFFYLCSNFYTVSQHYEFNKNFFHNRVISPDDRLFHNEFTPSLSSLIWIEFIYINCIYAYMNTSIIWIPDIRLYKLYNLMYTILYNLIISLLTVFVSNRHWDTTANVSNIIIYCKYFSRVGILIG